MGLILHLDPTARHNLDWPDTAAEVIGLGRSFGVHERTLVPEQRCRFPLPESLEVAQAAAEAAAKAVVEAETGRGKASEAFDLALGKARPLLKKMFAKLKVRHDDDLASLETYGLATKKGKAGVTVRQPSKDAELVSFLGHFVQKQSALPRGEQLDPAALETLAALAATVLEGDSGRDEQKTQRKVAVAARDAAVQRLRHLLQVAACVLSEQHFGGKVVADLERWGYRLAQPAPDAPEAAPVAEGQDGGPKPEP